eukprot:TRINITY_DN2351_c0_g1_i1.p3 TRINITY_DN2351_c0_g1~~TRINITY_DN2351_c0_g1_i1.p3  ORF type:complete len:191 (-),score=38.05 TRINITY_DN2351_c0_g1_i1:76-648(-)
MLEKKEKEWYNAQTARSINQCIGRIVRSKKDYGTLLLVDERFGQEQYKIHIADWGKQFINKVYENCFNYIQYDFELFFKTHRYQNFNSHIDLMSEFKRKDIEIFDSQRNNILQDYNSLDIQNNLENQFYHKGVLKVFNQKYYIYDSNYQTCLLYTSDAADDMQCVDLGGRRIIKKKKKKKKQDVRQIKQA